MKISRVSGEKIAPSWAFDLEFGDFAHFSKSDSERLQNTQLSLTDDDLVAQRDAIEKCANKKGYYFYNTEWDDKHIDDLKEYAMACGFDMSRFKAASPEYIEGIEVMSSEIKNSKMSRKASGENSALLADPFKLDAIDDDRLTTPSRDDWEKVSTQKVLAKRPSDMSGAIKPLRGGEDYFANQFTQTARGRNSLDNPNAIDQYLEETAEDNGERLRKENEERSNQRQKNHEEWESEKVAAQEHEDLLRGSVFPTEVMNAQTGIRKDFDLTKQNLPELTEGEMLVASSEERRQSIQRETHKDDWEVMQTQSVRGISDDFTESLKKALGK